MITTSRLTPLLALLLFTDCSALQHSAPRPGETAEQVRARLGEPTGVYDDGTAKSFEYATGPMGQTTWMAHFGPDGKLLNYEQVLTSEKFATIKIGQSRHDDVLRTLGRPAERSRVASHNYEVWSYRYKEAGAWNSMMHVHFDTQGVVQQMLNSPDPAYDPRDRGRW